MKILFAGGGSGGHFYPIIAVAREIRKVADEEGIVKLEMTFYSSVISENEQALLRQEDIKYRWVPAGKIRNYFSFSNFIDPFKTLAGTIKAIWSIFLDVPDVVFAKGGYASFPALLAARLLDIPIVIHESDTIPGKVNKWAASFAKRIAISFPETVKYFPEDEKTALTGHPVMASILKGDKDNAYNIFGFTKELPVIFVTGGSQGAGKINDVFLDIAPQVVEFAQVIHQAGTLNVDGVKKRATVVFGGNPYQNRYRIYGFLNEQDLRDTLSISTIAVSRPGAGSIFSFAALGLPVILVPITGSAQDHQRSNAYSYARTGAAHVIEEENLTGNLLLSEINRLLGDAERIKSMQSSAAQFARPDAAKKIAREIINLALEHS